MVRPHTRRLRMDYQTRRRSVPPRVSREAHVRRRGCSRPRIRPKAQGTCLDPIVAIQTDFVGALLNVSTALEADAGFDNKKIVGTLQTSPLTWRLIGIGVPRRIPSRAIIRNRKFVEIRWRPTAGVQVGKAVGVADTTEAQKNRDYFGPVHRHD